MILEICVALFILWTIIHIKFTPFIFGSFFHDLSARPYKKLKSKRFIETINKNIRFVQARKFFRRNFRMISILYVLTLIVLLTLSTIDFISEQETKHVVGVIESNSQVPTQLQYTPNLNHLGLENYPVRIVEVGCYSCEKTQTNLRYVREALAQQKGTAKYYFVNSLENEQEEYLSQVVACVEIAKPSEYWKVHTQLLEYEEYRQNPQKLLSLFSIPQSDIDVCIENKLYDEQLHEQEQFLDDHDVLNPVIFVENKVIFYLESSQQLLELIQKEI
jgi:hypothetical protein